MPGHGLNSLALGRIKAAIVEFFDDQHAQRFSVATWCAGRLIASRTRFGPERNQGNRPGVRFVDEGFQRSFDLRRTRSAIVVVPKRFFRPRDRGGDLFQKANALGAGVEPVGAADGQHTAPSAAKQSNADPIATDEGPRVVCDSVSRCAQIEAGMSLFDEPVEHVPQMFALAQLAKLAIALEIGSQIVERREKTEIAASEPGAALGR